MEQDPVEFAKTNCLAKAPIATTTKNVTSKNIPLTFTRYGDLVFVVADYDTSDWSAISTQTLDEVIPNGYRPSMNPYFSVSCVYNTGTGDAAGGQGFRMFSAGTIVFNTPAISSSMTCHMAGTICYKTSDTFPES